MEELTDTTVVVVSHDRSFLNDVCTDIIWLRHGQLYVVVMLFRYFVALCGSIDRFLLMAACGVDCGFCCLFLQAEGFISMKVL